MNDPRSIVILGAGQAGASAAFALRDLGYDGRLVLVGAEPHEPYERPPLSKGYLRGTDGIETTRIRPTDDYARADIDLRLGRRAVSIDRPGRTVALDDGTSLPYDRLLLATGSRPIRLSVVGADLAGVRYLRTRDDADALRTSASEAGQVVVIGGGWIGAEVAATLRESGHAVTLVTRSHLPLERVLGADVATVYAELHRERGVRLVHGQVAAVEGEGRVRAVRLADGTTLPADLVVAGLGARPEVGIALEAGLSGALGGIAVDRYLVTDDPAILAAGDVAAADHPLYGTRLRVEHWDNAIRQGRTAAANLLGAREAFERRPYFYSDQFDLGMEYRGHAPDADDVVLSGDVAGREFCAFWLRDGRVLAAMNANVWDAGDRLEALVASDTIVDRAALRRLGPGIVRDATAA